MHTMRRIGFIVLLCAAAVAGAVIALMVWLGVATGATTAAAASALMLLMYTSAVRPWMARWGAAEAEVAARMPGDELLRPGAPASTRAITIDASASHVWPWLLQIGYGRGGWYSYDWIDNDGIPSVERIEPRLQDLKIGDQIVMVPGMGPTVKEMFHEHHLLSGGERDTWCLMLRELGDGRTRLISRWRQDWPRSTATFLWTALAEPGSFVMERKMLLTIKQRAERPRRAVGLAA
jgi:hypothetical protein